MARRRKGRSFGGGGRRGVGGNALVAGVAGGVGASLGGQFIGGSLGAPVGTAAAGWFMKSDTLQTIAGFQFGQQLLAGGLNFGGGGAPAAGPAFL